MTVREEDRKSMRHSNSWPDQAPQTVKVRVDPLSRAFTIIPTIRGSFDPLLAAAKPGWIDDIVLLDHGRSKPVETGHRFVDETGVAERVPERKDCKKLDDTFELRVFVPDTATRSSVKDVAEDRGSKTAGSLSSDEHSDALKAERAAPEGMRSGHSIDEKRAENGGRNLRETPSQESALEDSEEDSPASKTIVQIEPREDRAGSSRDATAGKSFAIEIPGNTTPLKSSVAAAARPQHVCPKCTSEGLLLQQRFDPFRSAAPADESNLVREGRCRVAGSGKAETLRKYSAVEAKMRTSWQRIGATGLIGSTRNRCKERDKRGRRRNGEPLCRSTNDARKEATLRRHYYPEGGWGYVIVTCSALVHFLGIGLQLAAPGSWHLTAELKFHQPPLHSADEIDKQE
nr:uncharacterized protein LOC117227322 [Megalopta genalis]